MVKGSMSKRKPMILMFAGPNGSGKSTVTKAFLKRSPLAGIYINADDIKLEQNCSDLEAAKIATALREKQLKEEKDFTFETVLSTRRNLDLLLKAKEMGYFIKAFYVVTIDPKVNVERIADRVADGGHAVPSGKVESRFHKSLAMLPELVDVCDVLHIYDNTGKSPERIFKKKRESIRFFETEYWSTRDIENLTGKAFKKD